MKQDGVVDHFAGSCVSTGRVLGDFARLNSLAVSGFAHPGLCALSSVVFKCMVITQIYWQTVISAATAALRTNAALIDTKMWWIFRVMFR